MTVSEASVASLDSLMAVSLCSSPASVLLLFSLRLLSLPPAVMLNALSEPGSAAAITSE